MKKFFLALAFLLASFGAKADWTYYSLVSVTGPAPMAAGSQYTNCDLQVVYNGLLTSTCFATQTWATPNNAGHPNVGDYNDVRITSVTHSDPTNTSWGVNDNAACNDGSWVPASLSCTGKMSNYVGAGTGTIYYITVHVQLSDHATHTVWTEADYVYRFRKCGFWGSGCPLVQ